MPHRVLIIDDSEIPLTLLRSGLVAAGFEVVGASDLAAVSSALQTGPFQAVVVDLNMPETFGDDLLEFMREARGVKAPIIMYSDVEEHVLAERAKAVGADGYVCKTTGLPKLIEMIKGICARLEKKPAAPGKRVLIVDDSEMTARMIEAELAGKGFEITLADSADKATSIVIKKQTRPDLILLDVNMPNVDGASFCRFIKRNSLFKGIKVVLCSGMEIEKLKATAAECGADGVVPKDHVLSKWVLEQISAAEQKK